MTTQSPWQSVVSGAAELKLTSTGRESTSALRMDFDFKGGRGFVVARRPFTRPMPAEYVVRFRLRGRGPTNNLELKLVDTSGQNVWRYVRKDLVPPPRWKRMSIESRDIDFAWGPASGSTLAELGSIEIAIVAGEGGQGTWWLADLSIEDETPAAPPTLTASSELPGSEAREALAGRGWQPNPADHRPWISLDAHERRSFGGLIVDWLDRAPASGFRVRGSNTGHRWKTLYAAASADGKRSYVYLPNLKTRFLRLDFNEPTAGAALRPQSFEFSRSIHAFWQRLADDEPRAWHPRWLHREQTLWTPIGTAHGIHCALMNADGMVEVDQGSFSIEPMLALDAQLYTWAEATSEQALEAGWTPAPSVTWTHESWRFRTRAEATVSGTIRLHYQLDNLAERPLSVRLYLLIRPFQVTPPWQNFRKLGGVSEIRDLVWRDGAVDVNGTLRIVPAGAVAGYGSMRFDEGFIVASLANGVLPEAQETHDPFGFASGVLCFELNLAPGEVGERVVDCGPLARVTSREPVFEWRSKLATAQWQGHGWAAEAIPATLTATAHILVTRSGPALQPGPRRYTRSWIRDGAMMSAALLRMGHAAEVREFIDWYAPFQRADGFVPCCVDSEGPDWLVEHDSHGQLVALMADYHRFTRDDASLTRYWPCIDKSIGYIERLLGEDPLGLLPISVSHEGYLAQPVHSYWDDFWAVKALRDAVELARSLGRTHAAERWSALGARFEATFFASIQTTRLERKLDFIPGSIEWADFDPTATANALYLLDVPLEIDRVALEHTFEKYLLDWRGKRAGSVPAKNYTPYEIRIIGALVRLGKRDAALELLRFFLADRRPVPWNQWPEIAWRDRQAPAHLGDLPHTWIAAEFVLAVRSLFAYERGQALVLAAGLSSEWIDGSGVRVAQMPTERGPLSYSLIRTGDRAVRFQISMASPVELVLKPPLDAPLQSVSVNGVEWREFDENSITIRNTPAEVICTSL